MNGSPCTLTTRLDDTLPGLAFAVSVRLGDFTLSAAAHVGPGEVLAVIGANGSGKSTLLGALAGSHRISSGSVRLSGRVLSQREADTPETSLRRSDRRVGLLDQRARLFPHLNVQKNIAFAPRARGVARRAAASQADVWLDRVGLAGRGGARASELSGGQQQRVAIARTLASEPELLLLDEPFAALDVTSRSELRQLIARESRSLRVPAVLVSHDPLDLALLADHVMVLDSGEVAQQGSVSAVLGAPATPFAAAFTGRSLLRGTASSGSVMLLADAPIRALRGTGDLPLPGTSVVASFDPARVRVTPAETPADRSQTSVANGWCGRIQTVSAEPSGIRIDCAEWPEVTALLPLSQAFEPWLVPGARTHWEIPVDRLRFTTPKQRAE